MAAPESGAPVSASTFSASTLVKSSSMVTFWETWPDTTSKSTLFATR